MASLSIIESDIPLCDALQEKGHTSVLTNVYWGHGQTMTYILKVCLNIKLVENIFKKTFSTVTK